MSILNEKMFCEFKTYSIDRLEFSYSGMKVGRLRSEVLIYSYFSNSIS